VANQAFIQLLGRTEAPKLATPAHVVLPSLFARKPSIVPASGTRKLERLKEESIGAAVESIKVKPGGDDPVRAHVGEEEILQSIEFRVRKVFPFAELFSVSRGTIALIKKRGRTHTCRFYGPPIVRR
jgi:hypothetical protein